MLHLSDTISIFNGDCKSIEMPREIDAIITDPPYGIAHPCNFSTRKRGKLAKCNDWPDVAGDSEPFDPAWILELDRPTILLGANWYADKLPPSGGWLVWDKERPDTLDQSTCELAWTNCIKGVRRVRHRWNGMIKASERGESYHPTQKPVALFDWILGLKWVKNAKYVFDPYMGSAPCGVACAKQGRGYLGVEINAQYFLTAKMRIGKELEKQQACLSIGI